jgi:hypothetical protein
MEALIIPWVSLALKNRERPNMDIAVCSLSQLTSFYSVLCSGKVFRSAQVGTAARVLKKYNSIRSKCSPTATSLV